MNIKNLLATLALGLALSFSAFAADKVDINKADAATLAAALNGVGPSKADAIVAYRTENGPFADVDALANVKGIGAKTVEHNRDVISVGETESATKSSKGAK
ncbi:MAG: helix-hairpin-helix domain-containing protein [Dokdonella sp.]